jgi:hypothetical protein
MRQDPPHRRFGEVAGLSPALTLTLALAVAGAVAVGALLAHVFGSPAIEGAASAAGAPRPAERTSQAPGAPPADRWQSIEERWARFAAPAVPPAPMTPARATQPTLRRRSPWSAASESERLGEHRRTESRDDGHGDRRDLVSERRNALDDARQTLRSLDDRVSDLRGRIVAAGQDHHEREKLQERLADTLREIEQAEREVVRAEWALRAAH